MSWRDRYIKPQQPPQQPPQIKLVQGGVPIPMKTPRHSDLMAPWIPT